MKRQLQSLLGAAVHFPHVHVAPGAKDFNDPNELLLTPIHTHIAVAGIPSDSITHC